MIFLKTHEEINKIKRACMEVVEILDRLKEEVKEGVSTWDLNSLAEDLCRQRRVVPAFKGYSGYPAAVCFALNEEVVHGIPSKKKVLKEGDILGIDFGVYLDGYYGDSAITLPVGRINSVANKLLKVTETALLKGVEKAVVNNYVYDISKAIQSHVEDSGFSVVKSFVGHGIGRKLHEEPQIPNFVPKEVRGRGVRLKAGMVIAIEPMVNEGTEDVKILEDGWTAVTADGRLSAHFEHTVAITEKGPEVLTSRN